MSQGLLAFKYEEEKKTTGMPALAGLPVVTGIEPKAGLAKLH